ncbi:fasciclin domain-containing protein [Roseivivax sp. THAF30]|uniref:fasciclin domain-containing protein n=1 Tax=Roseivivax sp. THAF30 TaxID=2587852 RepID=UPI001268FC56|nr:fasciclin domain-containing protein [Roseivivax sp. THAF30]
MKALSIIAIAAIILTPPALAQDNPMVGGAEMFADRTIVENAVNSEDLTTLVAAVQQAGLVDTLSGEGPFTVFAPTDEAFAALPNGTLDALMMDDDADQLASILTYHIVPRRLDVDDLRDGMTVSTLQGSSLEIENDGTVTVGGARIVSDAIPTSNGVIYAVDSVIIPGTGPDDTDDPGPSLE